MIVLQECVSNIIFGVQSMWFTAAFGFWPVILLYIWNIYDGYEIAINNST